MEVSELLASVAAGTRFSAVMPADKESYLRSSLLRGLSLLGYTVHPCGGCASVIDRVQTPGLDEGQSSLDAYIVQFPSADLDIKSATALASSLSKSDGAVVLFEVEEYPPKKTKAVASLLSKVVVLEVSDGVGTIPWVTSQSAKAGLNLSARCAALLQARIAGCPSALDSSLRVLRLYCGDRDLVTEQDIADSVSFIVDGEDGRAVLDDLLHQRSMPLSRRISVMQESRLVPLFRYAASELVIINQVSCILADADKGRFDYQRATDALGIPEDKIKNRYLPIAKALGIVRSKAMLDLCSTADTLLLRTPYDSRSVALAMALNICRQ